jgi:hypothetical protein
MKFKEISIKTQKQSRDRFLGLAIENNNETALADLAIEIFEEVPQFSTKYDRANARAVVAILWWFAGNKENARLHIDQAKKELSRPDMVRDRLVFLADQAIEFEASGFRSLFIEAAHA